MNYETIILQKEEGIATITLNRPDKLNSLTPKMLDELQAVTEELAQDDNVKVVVITGAGRAFCAGADLDHPIFDATNPADVKEMMQKFHQIPLNTRNMTKPVIASVNGAAVGAGCNYALACDIIVASEKARFGQVFVGIGLHSDCGGTYFLPRLVGVAKACELLFTGKIIDAKEAERIGLVNQVVAEDQLEAATKELALSLAKGPSLAINMIKTSIYQGLEMDLASALEREAAVQSICILTEDCKEGIRAFKEKRKPMFKGR